MAAVIIASSTSTADPCGAPPRIPSATSSNVAACGELVVRQGDAYLPHACPGAPPHGATAAAGSGTVNVNGKALHREGDAISCGSVGANGCADVNVGG